jgi:hypothetical protein
VVVWGVVVVRVVVVVGRGVVVAERNK